MFSTEWLKPMEKLVYYNGIIRFAERKVSDVRAISNLRNI